MSDKCTLLALSKEAFEKYLGNLDSLMQKVSATVHARARDTRTNPPPPHSASSRGS